MLLQITYRYYNKYYGFIKVPLKTNYFIELKRCFLCIIGEYPTVQFYLNLLEMNNLKNEFLILFRLFEAYNKCKLKKYRILNVTCDIKKGWPHN